jgi:hypothetical protein
VLVAAIWLIGQCIIFVRKREQLAHAPVSLVFDDEGALIAWPNWFLIGRSRASPRKRCEPAPEVSPAKSVGCRKNSLIRAFGRP